MTRALYVVRQSQGEDDDTASLRLQRKVVPRLARNLTSDWNAVDAVDLGVHTGFSIHSRDRDASRIDANPNVTDAVQRVEDGEYDYIVAWDDTRLARDDYFAAWKGAAKFGGAEFAFVEEADVGSLTHGVRRKVEEHVKKDELKKALAAWTDREEEGKWNYPAPTGLEYDDQRDYLQPGEGFYACLQVITMREAGESWTTIADRAGVARSTARNIYDREPVYTAFVDRGGVVDSPQPVPANA
ncbi:resolvase domain protein [Natrinema thermotolerans DSM 11552]|nr:resolvase domain protein [Natrinema thermotolerans DSM 11552]